MGKRGKKLGLILSRLGKVALDAISPIELEFDDLLRDAEENDSDDDESVESEVRIILLLARITQRLERIEQDVVGIKEMLEGIEE